MPQQVTGYITSDGKFFKIQTEAEFHEAAEAMMTVLTQNEMSEDVLTFLTTNEAEITKFLSAWRNFNARGKTNSIEHKDKTIIHHAPNVRRV